jgi:hypothetical protein
VSLSQEICKINKEIKENKNTPKNHSFEVQGHANYFLTCVVKQFRKLIPRNMAYFSGPPIPANQNIAVSCTTGSTIIIGSSLTILAM